MPRSTDEEPIVDSPDASVSLGLTKRQIRYKRGEKYIADCFKFLTALSHRSRQVEEALRFLEKRPSEALLKRYRMSHQEYFDYHFNILLAYYVSFPECVHQVINSVLNLGIAPKDVGREVLEKNKWVNEVGLRGNIRTLEKLRSNYAHDRNRAVHQGLSKDFFGLTMYFAQDFYCELLASMPGQNAKIDRHKVDKRKVFEQEVELVLGPVRENFETMLAESDKVQDKLIQYFDFWIDRGKGYASAPRNFTVKKGSSQ